MTQDWVKRGGTLVSLGQAESTWVKRSGALIQVGSFGSGPSAGFSARSSGLTITFSALTTASGLTYAWDFGDGTNGTGRTTTRTYASAGTKTVGLVVTDSAGLSSFASRDIIVVAGNVGPNASFTASPSSLGVSVNASASTDPDGVIEDYSWNWGDGTAAGSGVTASHTYASAGTRSITLTVTDNAGATAISTRDVSVVPSNVGPTASFVGNVSGKTVYLDASASADQDGTITTYSWVFGDGATATGAITSHTYSTTGTKNVQLTVLDNAGATGSATRSFTLTTSNVSPTASFIVTASGLVASVNASGSTDSDGTIASYSWAWGDGTTTTGSTSSHTYTTSGTKTITLTITDDGGATATATRSVTLGSSASSSYIPGWGNPVWSDEFTTAGINTSKWNARNNATLSYDQAIIYTANNVINGDGYLRQKVERLGTPVNQGGRMRYFSVGYLDTIGKFSQKYGRWEMRAITPLTPNVSKAIWPAFWLRDSTGTGECDVMEAYGTPRAHMDTKPAGVSEMTIHQDTNHSSGTVKINKVPSVTQFNNADGQFHTYAVEWTPEGFRFLYDGIERWFPKTAQYPWFETSFTGGLNIRLDVQMGDSYYGFYDPAHPETTVLPVEYVVDYIRVWAYTP
jgi:PKD repeat protein